MVTLTGKMAAATDNSHGDLELSVYTEIFMIHKHTLMMSAGEYWPVVRSERWMFGDRFGI